MSWGDVDAVSRTGKILLDSNRVASPEEADAFLKRLVLQVDVGPGLESVPAAQAALATVVNTGHRAFRGGVRVRADDDPLLTDGWVAGQHLSAAVAELGGEMTDTLDASFPTIVIGDPARHSTGMILLWTTWRGWAGGVVEEPSDRLAGDAIAVAGVVSGALAVSEAFQNVIGSVTAGRRSTGISLWLPGRDWRDPEAVGPRLGWLPSSLWLLGLGHLGQGYAWSLGWLPYATPGDVLVYLMDTEKVVKGNVDTGLLLRDADRSRRKTRVVAERLESDLGMRTAIVERLYDEDVWPTGNEPLLALGGFDDPAPRRKLGGTRGDEPRFGRVVDGGLGSGPVEYLGIRLYTFPSQVDPANAFPDPERVESVMPTVYQDEIDRRVAAGTPVGKATCGVTDIAGVTVAVAFVGATAGALVVADVLRHLHGGPEIAILSVDLRSPHHIDVPDNTDPGPYFNPGTLPPRSQSSGWTGTN